MSAIREVTTLTSKGQITLPKSIRQVLGVDHGGQVAFDFRDGQVIVTRVEAEEHEDPAIGAFLDVLEGDIRSGRHVGALPEELAQALLASAGHGVNITDEIGGDVAL